MSQPIRFYHRHAIQEVSGASTTRTVLQYLREDARCTGTKEGCAEGDCGACTVVIGEPDGNGGVEFKAVNACVQFLPTLDGHALFTVEDLRQRDGSLHPEQALIDCHGSQCGFYTPRVLRCRCSRSTKSTVMRRPAVHTPARRPGLRASKSAMCSRAICAAARDIGRLSTLPSRCSITRRSRPSTCRRSRARSKASGATTRSTTSTPAAGSTRRPPSRRSPR